MALQDQTSIVGAPGREGDGAPQGVHDFGGVYLYDISQPPPVQCNPAFPPTDTLEDSGAITGPSGFTLSAPPGTLSAPLSIWLREVAPPVEPLFAGATPLGAYYNIGSQCTAASRPDHAFVLEFPVPDPADTAELSVAVLVPDALVLDGVASGSSWDLANDPIRKPAPVRGHHGGLASEGMTFVLIEQPGATASARPGGNGLACEGPPQFEVECHLTGATRTRSSAPWPRAACLRG